MEIRDTKHILHKTIQECTGTTKMNKVSGLFLSENNTDIECVTLKQTIESEN